MEERRARERPAETPGAGCEVAVVLSRVTEAFGGFVAFEGVSLGIGEDELFSLLGPSGRETTTLRTTAGFEEPTRGEVSGAGGVPLPTARRHRLPVLRHLPPRCLRRGGFRLREGRRQKGRAPAEACGMVRLSGGQRVALARALVDIPRALLRHARRYPRDQGE